jgi:deoxyribose-phosphate aldolase
MPVDISKLTKEEVARLLDYALLTPEFQHKDYLDGCQNILKYKFACYQVLPFWTEFIVSEIGDFCRENQIEISSVISFPYGSATIAAKMAETENQLKIGATGLDMVANLSWLKDHKYDLYQKDCNEFVKLCHSAGATAKIIISVGYLNAEQIVDASKMVIEAGADYVKTATGTGPAGRPNFQDAQLILDTIAASGTNAKLKVSGVVEPRIFNAYCFIRLGAKRIGGRGAPQIVDALPEVQKYLFPGNV